MSKEIDTRFTVRPQWEGFEEDFFINVVRFLKFEKKKRNVKLSIFLLKTNHHIIYCHLDLF